MSEILARGSLARGELETRWRLLEESARSSFIQAIVQEFDIIGDSYESLSIGAYVAHVDTQKGRKRQRRECPRPEINAMTATAECEERPLDHDQQATLLSFLQSPNFFNELLCMEIEVSLA